MPGHTRAAILLVAAAAALAPDAARATVVYDRVQARCVGNGVEISWLTLVEDDTNGFKVYRENPEGDRKYSPAEVSHTEIVPVMGNPDPARICTSIVERQNLTIRMQMRRLTRLTNGFSKRWDSLWSAYCLHFAYYNFCRIHKTLRVTPAMEAGITDRVWEIADLLA